MRVTLTTIIFILSLVSLGQKEYKFTDWTLKQTEDKKLEFYYFNDLKKTLGGVQRATFHNEGYLEVQYLVKDIAVNHTFILFSGGKIQQAEKYEVVGSYLMSEDFEGKIFFTDLNRSFMSQLSRYYNVNGKHLLVERQGDVIRINVDTKEEELIGVKLEKCYSEIVRSSEGWKTKVPVGCVVKDSLGTFGYYNLYSDSVMIKNKEVLVPIRTGYLQTTDSLGNNGLYGVSGKQLVPEKYVIEDFLVAEAWGDYVRVIQTVDSVVVFDNKNIELGKVLGRMKDVRLAYPLMYEVEGGIGYFDYINDTIVKYPCEEGLSFDHTNSAAVKEAGNWKIIQRDGSYVVPDAFDELSYKSPGFYGLKKGDQYYVYDRKDKKITETGFDEIRSVRNFDEVGYFVCSKGEQEVLLKGVNQVSKEYAKIDLDDAFIRDVGYIVIENAEQKKGVLEITSISAEEVVAPTFDRLSIYLIKEIYNLTKEVVLAYAYAEEGKKEQGLNLFYFGSEIELPMIYGNFQAISTDGLFGVSYVIKANYFSSEFDFFDLYTGRQLFPFKMTAIGSDIVGFYPIENKDGIGITNDKGSAYMEPMYADMYLVDDEYVAALTKTGLYGLFTTDDFTLVYDTVYSFITGDPKYEGFIKIVDTNKQVGLYSMELAKSVVPVMFDHIQNVQDGLAFIVSSDKRKGVYLPTGKRIIKVKNEELYYDKKRALFIGKTVKGWNAYDLEGKKSFESEFETKKELLLALN